MTKKPKKILLFTRPLAPPWDEASKNLAFDLARKSKSDFCFHLLTTKESTKESLGLAHNQNVVLEKIYFNVKLTWKEKLALFLKLFGNLDYDIIHFLFTPRGLTSWFIRARLFSSKAKTIQTVATVPDILLENKKDLKKIFFADQIIAQSEHTKKKLQKAGLDNVQVIYPGIDLEKFSPHSSCHPLSPSCHPRVGGDPVSERSLKNSPKNKEILDIAKEIGIEKTDFVLLFAGEYTRTGNIDWLFEVFKKLHAHDPKFKLIMAARLKSEKDKQKKEELEKWLKENNLENAVIFEPMCKNMPALYNLANAHIFLAEHMTGKFDIPFVIIEAMACGAPTIVSRLPVLEEFIKNGHNGYTVENENTEELFKKIMMLKNNPQLHDQIKKQGLAYVKENFDIEKTAMKYDEVYSSAKCLKNY